MMVVRTKTVHFIHAAIRLLMGRPKDKNAAVVAQTQDDSLELAPTCPDQTPRRVSSHSTASFHTAKTQKSGQKASKDDDGDGVTKDLMDLKKAEQRRLKEANATQTIDEDRAVSFIGKVDQGVTSRGVTKEEEEMLKNFSFYHGYLPREDLKELLRSPEDYLVRVSETDDKPTGNSDTEKASTREIILSVLINMAEQKCAGGKGKSHMSNIRNIIIKRNSGQYYIAKPHLFDSMELLIAHYKQNPGRAGKKLTFKLKNSISQQEWEFNHKMVISGELLGQGAFGEVRSGTLTREGQTIAVAIKVTKGTADLNKDKIKEVMQEARLMRKLRHDNIVCIYGVAVDEQPIYIVLELVTGGALGKYLKSNAGKVIDAEKLWMCYGAAQGVAYLHQKGMMHRDLAARNCLLTKERNVKISDFGLSMYAKTFRMTTSMKLPIKWLAPETIRSFVFSLETDIFSYGVLLYEIWSDGADPWAGLTNTEVKKQVTAGQRVRIPKSCPQLLRAHIKEYIFNNDPAKRASMKEVVEVLEKLGAKSVHRNQKNSQSTTPKQR